MEIVRKAAQKIRVGDEVRLCVLRASIRFSCKLREESRCSSGQGSTRIGQCSPEKWLFLLPFANAALTSFEEAKGVSSIVCVGGFARAHFVWSAHLPRDREAVLRTERMPHSRKRVAPGAAGAGHR